MSEPNLRVLKPSGKKPIPGDVFALSPLEGMFLFGRVIRSDLPRERAPMPGANLIYVYRHRSGNLQPDRTELHAGALLLPPLFINQLPWTKGYFQSVAQLAVVADRSGGPALLLECWARPVLR